MFPLAHKLFRKNINAALVRSAYGFYVFLNSWQLLAPMGTDRKRSLFSARVAGDEFRCEILFRTFRKIWSRRDHRSTLSVLDA